MTIEPVELVAADGVRLEAELSVPAGASAAVVLAHPHPRYGGDMRSALTASLFDALPAAGVAALRFNFRCVGGSSGSHGDGRSEPLDVSAAVAFLAGAAPGVPLVVSGWSFGADVSLAVTDPAVSGWAAVAPPLSFVAPDRMGAAADPRPKLVVLAQHDQFRDPASAGAVLDGWRATRVEVVAGADHFFAGHARRVAELIVGWLGGDLRRPA